GVGGGGEAGRRGWHRGHGRRPDRGAVCARLDRGRPRHPGLAMTATAHLVTVGAMPCAGADGAAVADALAAEAITLASRVFIEDDEAALERALGHDDALTVVLAGGGGGGLGGDGVRRGLARATGTRLVLNERVLAALQERYRRVDRPLPRRAERLALLPQGATVWVADDGESGWSLVTGSRAFAVLARDGSVSALISRHLSPF